MKPAFISYTRADIQEARALTTALRRSGIRPWRDEDNLPVGSLIEKDLRRVIREECGGAVLWLSQNALQATWVMDVELPEILDRAALGGFPFVPVFVDMTPEEASRLVKERTGKEILPYKGLSVRTGTDDMSHQVRKAASQFVIAHVTAAQQVSAERPIVRATTRSDTAQRREEAILDFNWRSAYEADGLPEPIVHLELKSALAASIDSLLSAIGPGDVRVEAKTHLSVATALGHALRRPTGVFPFGTHEEVEWRAQPGKPPEAAGADLAESIVPGSPDADDLAVEVSIARNVTSGVDSFIDGRGLPFRGRLQFVPANGPDQTIVRSGLQMNVWAEQIVQRAIEVRDDVGAGAMALFMAIPIPLAVLLGWRMNAAGRVVIYEWRQNVGPYVPAWSFP